MGPSPRVRGSPGGMGRPASAAGSIPACAGKPRRTRAAPRTAAVHPRVCGEADVDARAHVSVTGPSPRVRGSLPGLAGGRDGHGSIPACAGKPPAMGRKTGEYRVHPRVCGEADPRRCAPAVVGGPSPRVRGSRRPAHTIRGSLGSIPACAGKPRRRPSRSRSGAVHPRVCGEAPRRGGPRWSASGPSPRVRGSRARPIIPSIAHGSIPACAGKPASASGGQRGCGVHPRVCGEACRPRLRPRARAGPSPRVRGSPGRGTGAQLSVWSIPACAGKPLRR